MDWGSLASGGKDAVISGLDIRAVMNALGVATNGEELIPCPFHAERTGSMNVFIGDDGKQRFHCHGCGARGDVIDFVGRRLGLSYGDALARCNEFLAEGLPAPTPSTGGAEPADLRRVLDAARETGRTDPIVDLLANPAKPGLNPIDPSWLIETFRLAVNDRGEIVIPHFAAGMDNPRAVKRRSGDSKAAYSGSRLTVLYGSHLDQRAHRVVLCEGETDTWAVAWLLRNERVTVLGLPRGVGAAVEADWLEQLKGRDVTLLFDPDNAGRAGMKRWVLALRPHVETVRLALLPETTDAAACAPETVFAALSAAQPAPNETDLPVYWSSGGYMQRSKPTKADPSPPPTPLTDWTLTILSRTEILGESVSYSVRLPNGSVTRLAHADLRNQDTLARWANRWGLTTSATGPSVQHLMRLFEAQSVYVPRRIGVSVAGWHYGRFVLPDRVLGVQDVEYVAPQLDVRWERRLALTEPGPAGVQRSVLITLSRLHRPSVMTPILGWVFAAPLRALCAQFPALAVMGSAGSGKTTIVSTVLGALGYTNGTPVTVSNSTWHAVWAMAGSTNGLPVWFDEYRAGTRQDGVAALEQAIRDAWNGAATLRGGIGENKSALHDLVATAPIVVSGEGAFQEASHAERTVYVPLTRDGRDPEALLDLRRMDTRGLGLDYLRWLVHIGLDGITAPPALPDRPAQAIAVARWGYELLLEWLGDRLAESMPEWDPSLVAAKQEALIEANPYREALLECYGSSDGLTPLVWPEGNDILVRFGRIPSYIRQHTTIVLPGGEGALKAWLEENYRVRYQSSNGGRVARLVGAADSLTERLS